MCVDLWMCMSACAHARACVCVNLCARVELCVCVCACVRARVRVCVCALRADRSEDGRLGSGCGRLECDVACRDGGAETSHE